MNICVCRLSGGDNGSNKVRNNAAVVANATKQTRGDLDVVKKREELQRRIEETRRKLQSVSTLTLYDDTRPSYKIYKRAL